MKKSMSLILNSLHVKVILLLLVCLACILNINAQPVYQWKNVAVGGGSYVTGILIHPKEKDLVYIKTDIGGCYRWNEDEMRWIPLTDHLTVAQGGYGGQSIAIDPGNPDVVYIAVRGGTLLKSADRGDNWIELKMDVPMGASLWWCTEPLKADPFNSDVILYVSRNRELFKSVNGGESWESKGEISSSEVEFGVLGIMFDPTERGKVYANSFEDGIYESTNGGDSWHLLEGSPRGVLKMALSREGTLYTAGRAIPKIAKMNPDGSWSDINWQKYRITPDKPPSTRRALADFNFCGIDVNPLNSNHIVVSLDYKTPNKIIQSFNGGKSWSEVVPELKHTVPWWPEAWWGGGVADLAISPHDPGQVWFVDFKGIWRTNDILKNPSAWTNLEDGHEEICITDLIAPPAAASSRGYMLMSCAYDVDGFTHYDLNTYPESKNGPPHYQHTYDIDYCASDPKYVVRVGDSRALDCMGNFIVPEVDPNPFGGSISADEGSTWKAFESLPIDYGVLTVVAMSATDPEIFIVMTREGPAYRTDDGGFAWHKIETFPDRSVGSEGFNTNTQQLLAADKVNGQKFYYYIEGKIYRSTDAGKTFQPTTASLPVVGGGENMRRNGISLKAVSDIEGEVWIGLDEEGLFRSSDSGSSFNRLKKVERVLLFDFGKPLKGMDDPVLYLYGTVEGKDGVFRSLDFGKKWEDITPKNEVGIGSGPRIMVASKQHAGLVFIGTWGRGIYYGMPDER
jgi:xyloglucan-specific exo-beta-1,4-glucanase